MMVKFTLTQTNDVEQQKLTKLSSLVFHVPAEKWDKGNDNGAVFREFVAANKLTLKHVEIIVPTVDALTLISALDDVDALESFAIQWPHRGPTNPALLLDLASLFDKFMYSLTALLTRNARTLQRLRISLTAATMQEPFSRLTISESTLPPLPALRLLDLTHSGLFFSTLVHFLSPHSPVPALEHLIIDQGFEIPADASCESDSDDEDDSGKVGAGLVAQGNALVASWPAVGRILAARTPPLKSLCAALHETRFHFGMANRLTRPHLRKLLVDGVLEARGEDEAMTGAGAETGTGTGAETGTGAGAESRAAEVEDLLHGLVVDTAWPITYAQLEPHADIDTGDGDLYEHVPGCGHLAYPEDRRPTPGLWPAEIPEMLGWSLSDDSQRWY